MYPIRVKEYPLRKGGFARIDVGTDTDVSDFLKVGFHWVLSSGKEFFGSALMIAQKVLGARKKKSPYRDSRTARG
jgi:hypothetical protein